MDNFNLGIFFNFSGLVKTFKAVKKATTCRGRSYKFDGQESRCPFSVIAFIDVFLNRTKVLDLKAFQTNSLQNEVNSSKDASTDINFVSVITNLETQTPSYNSYLSKSLFLNNAILNKLYPGIHIMT